MIRFALLAALGAISFGCATPPDQPQTAAAGAAPANAVKSTAPMPVRARPAITGSRLVPLDSDDPGAAYVGAVSGDDWRKNEDTRVKILCGESPAACSSSTGARLH